MSLPISKCGKAGLLLLTTGGGDLDFVGIGATSKRESAAPAGSHVLFADLVQVDRRAGFIHPTSPSSCSISQ
jgi:hypothetical protein